jgi:S-adenosylmethionine-diacylglycerol 3-amino-3-carboxypropyl transferase
MSRDFQMPASCRRHGPDTRATRRVARIRRGNERSTVPQHVTARHIDRLHDRIFQSIYSRSLVYNACWEDPAVDRLALRLGPDDDVLVITSAGCNALDYLLTGPRRIDAVDMNPRQNALLELKLAGIRALDFPDFFRLFGGGCHPRFNEIYRELLRPHLGEFAREFWDDRGHWFEDADSRRGFYFYGLSGRVARAFHVYLDMSPALRRGVDAILDTRDIGEQRAVYDRQVAPHLWDRKVNWVLSRQFTMNMLGVPHTQRREVERQHAGGVAGFVREAIEYVFRQIPLNANYFWRLYLEGCYSHSCCPEYLKRANFQKLKAGLVDRLFVHTCSVTEFLRATERAISRFVLLDHMDWMSSARPDALAEEWQAILARSAPGARIIFRSAHFRPAYLDAVRVPIRGGSVALADRLRFHPELADELQRHDRVHTYAGFHIADVRA